jgi:hypothetical protein
VFNAPVTQTLPLALCGMKSAASEVVVDDDDDDASQLICCS